MPRYRESWHHRAICTAIDRLLAGSLPGGKRRLMIQAPPRHGKSELCSRRLPPYALLRDPDLEVVAASYASPLAKAMARDVKRVIRSPEFRGLTDEVSLVERKNLAATAINQADIFEIPNRLGRYMAVGVGGSLTGYGMGLGVVDDPFKDRAQADSPTYRDRVWDWYTSTFATRDDGRAKILAIWTPWHADDLGGRLLKEEGDAWHVMRFPALLDEPAGEWDPREQGEYLWPGRFTEEHYTSARRRSSRDWEALYQCRPVAASGNMFARGAWRRFDRLPKQVDQMVQSWDLTFQKTTDGSYVVGQVWARRGADYYLIDQVRGRWGFVETCEQIRALTRKHPEARAKLIERKANGAAVLDALGREVGGMIPVEPKGGKEERGWAVEPYVAAGNVHLPERAPWVGEFIEEAAAFPVGAHDDQVDAMTQAIRYLDAGGLTALRALTSW